MLYCKQLKAYIDKLIRRDQTGFLKDRFIRENITLVSDFMNYTEQKYIPGLLMLIDFRKVVLLHFLGIYPQIPLIIFT